MSDRLWLAEKPGVTGIGTRVVQNASTVEGLRDDGWTVYGPFVAVEERNRMREALEWIYAEPEDPIKVQMWALAALGRSPAGRP